jgi:CheY-like chemotaxis protein
VELDIMTPMGQDVGLTLEDEARVKLNSGIHSLRSLRQPHILVVDDDWGVRETLTLLLSAAGYVTSAAPNGVEALQEIKKHAPTLLLCDLEMPRMSGFELLSIVRRRFPEVAVIAMSGSYAGDAVPDDVLADAFYSKGEKRPPELFRIVEEVIRNSAAGLRSHVTVPAPTWARCIGRDKCGTSFILVSCADCLRSFSVTMSSDKTSGIYEARCIFCTSEIRYIVHQYPAAPKIREVFPMLVKNQEGHIRSQPGTLLQE